MGSGGFFILAVSIYMSVLIYLTLEATEERNCVIYCDTDTILIFMVYILLTEIKDRHNYQRESLIGIFSSYLKGLDNNCRR